MFRCDMIPSHWYCCNCLLSALSASSSRPSSCPRFPQSRQSLNHKPDHISPLLSHCRGSHHPLEWHTRRFLDLPSSLAPCFLHPTAHPICQSHLRVFSALNHKLCVAQLIFCLNIRPLPNSNIIILSIIKMLNMVEPSM